MNGFDSYAVLRSLRGFALLESTTGRVHYVAEPGMLTDVVVEGMDRFLWRPRALCGQTPPLRWVSITHLGDKNQSCRSCLARWNRLLSLFDRLDPSKQTTHPKKET
jgi:hypothetical protein